MVLLIHIPIAKSTKIGNIFTFHYGSTYTSAVGDEITLFLHLHSTMVLLILRTRKISEARFNIYIPLWFYLYHFALLWVVNIDIIYIPLWFYLYGLIGGIKKASDSDLHSTMVLLIRLLPRPAWSFRSAFTFHYGSTYTSQNPTCVMQSFIYIPLWFYLYEEWKSDPESFCEYLHSTMVLLILCLRLRDIISVLIYIPLWFYLYNICHHSHALNIKFTFHYGSTYTLY